MKTEIKDEVGVTMAGPDDPALARAKARDHGGEAYPSHADRMKDPAYRAEISQLGLMCAGSVGEVAQRQAGILPTGGLRVTDAMIEGGVSAAKRLGLGLDREGVRAILEASLRG